MWLFEHRKQIYLNAVVELDEQDQVVVFIYVQRLVIND